MRRPIPLGRHPLPGIVPGLILALVALPWLAAAAGATPAPLPTPLGRVSDFAQVIDPAFERAITARLEELARKTTAEIAVVTIESAAPDTVFDYTIRLAEAWKPGAADKDNGVVFLTAVADRELFIATGYGLEGALPDGLVGEIRDQVILPRFRTGDIAGGIRDGVERMAAIIARECGVELASRPAERVPHRRTQEGPIPPLWLTLLALLVLAALVMAAAEDPRRRRRRATWDAGPMWGGGFGGGGFGGSGGFGGFGGGSFGGGGAGGKW